MAALPRDEKILEKAENAGVRRSVSIPSASTLFVVQIKSSGRSGFSVSNHRCRASFHTWLGRSNAQFPMQELEVSATSTEADVSQVAQERDSPEREIECHVAEHFHDGPSRKTEPTRLPHEVGRQGSRHSIAEKGNEPQDAIPPQSHSSAGKFDRIVQQPCETFQAPNGFFPFRGCRRRSRWFAVRPIVARPGVGETFNHVFAPRSEVATSEEQSDQDDGQRQSEQPREECVLNFSRSSLNASAHAIPPSTVPIC